MMRRILAFFLAFVLAFGMVPVQVFAQENTNETIVEENGSSAEDVAAAQAVTDQIAGLGEVTLESGSQIAQIRAAYEALTQEQKDLVSGLDALKAAEESLAEQKTQADKQAAQTVTEQIAAIGTVTEDSQNAISAARAAYDELTDIQKGYVENLSILEAAETAFAELQQQESQSQAPVVTSEKSEEEATATSLDTSDLTFDVEKPDGYVTVSFVDNGIRPENANILNAELYGTAVGTIIAATEVPYVEGDSVADVTVRLLKAMNLEYSSTGTADDGFYLSSLNGFELNGTYYATFGEFDAGSQSGWCVRVNNWHINQGSSAVEVEDGDVISWLYTCQYGADIGADFSTRSAEITGVVLADSTLNLAYDAETDQYTCVVPAETTAIAFEVFLENYASIVTMTVDGNTVKYRPNQDIRVTPNSTIVIRSELEYMDADKDNKEGTIFQWDTAANDFVAGWNGKPSTGWSSTKDTFKTFIFGSRTSTISVYPTFAYAGQRVMIYVDGEEFEEAVTNWKSKTIPVDADGTTITFHVNSEKYHAAQVAAGVEDPFAEPEKKYTLLVESVEPLGIDSKILSAELEGGEFYKPGFSSDSYTISALIPAGQTTVNLTFTVPAGIDVYKTSVTDANKLATEQTDEDGNLVYTTPIVTITGTGMYAYSTTNIILQVTDEEGNIGKTQYAFTVSQRGTKDVYPDRVVDYLAIGSQYTNASSYGTMPERTLKSGGGTLSLGNFGGYIIYQYDIPIQNSPNNPYGVDFVVYGNSFGNGAHEPGYVQVSKDGETWYTLAGSEHYEDHNDWGYVMTYTNNDGKSAWTNSDGESGEIYNYPVASAYPYYDWTEAKEQSITVFGPRLNSEAKDAYGSAAAVLPVFGYVDVNTNGTINGTSNNPYNHPGTLVAGGDQFDLAWAVDETGMPVSLDSVSYIRIATASSIYAGAIGEKSTEVTAVNRVTNGAEAAVGVTASPSAITVNGKTVAAPADGGILTVTVAEETLDVAVTAVEGTNIYIGNVGSAQRSYTALPGKGIIRIIAQEGQKEPYICYLKLREPCTGTDVDVTWGNFGNNETNNRITAAATPKSIDYTHLNWVKTYGGKPSLQIIVDNALVFMSGNTLYKVSLADGSVLDSTTMDGSSAYTYIAPTYANGMIFCALNGGKVQAFDAATLDSLWIYTDELGGQDQVPITYSDDCVYTGFWSGETKDASYVCIDVASGEKVWSLKHTGGFYWAGAVVIGDAILFGSDDGANGTKGNGTVYTVNKKTGEVISTLSLTGLGDQRSTIVYDNGRVYFTTKGGYVCSAAVASDGSLSDLKNVKASGVFASTCTPVVYGDYIYYGASSKYFVIADKDTLETKHTVTMQGYSQHSSLLSTAYAVTDGYLYFYTTYNAKPGGISLIKVDADAADFTAEGACQLIELYDARGYEEYCISGIITDASGNLYYKNDSGCIFSIGKTVTAVPQFTQNLTSDEVKYNYQIDEAAQALTVAATVADEGLLTYQWQRSADGANWTDIADATAASYVPPITELGTVYYRCVAVNTLNGVSEKAVSEAAMIVVKTFNSDTSLAYVVTNSNSKPSVSFATVVNTPAVINTSGNNKPRVWLTGPADGTVAVEQVVGTDKITVADSSGYLYEFDCGFESGWMYEVNDGFPNYGSSAYELKPGDIIAWKYTCTGLGTDVGAERME